MEQCGEPGNLQAGRMGQKEEDGVHEKDQGERDTKVGGTDGGCVGGDMEDGGQTREYGGGLEGPGERLLAKSNGGMGDPGAGAGKGEKGGRGKGKGGKAKGKKGKRKTKRSTLITKTTASGRMWGKGAS